MNKTKLMRIFTLIILLSFTLVFFASFLVSIPTGGKFFVDANVVGEFWLELALMAIAIPWGFFMLSKEVRFNDIQD